MPFLLLLLPLLLPGVARAEGGGGEPNPPVWPASVRVFSPGDADIDSVLAAAYATNGGHVPSNNGQFSDKRYAFLFQPGWYDVDAPVGYYTQVMGLGGSPGDVVFTSPKGVYSQEQDFSIGGALSTFWRSAENFRNQANFKWYVGTGMMWAVSQAAPLRRVEVDNDLLLFEYEPPIPGAGEASGGYFANVKVDHGAVKPGSQQQWFARDSTVNQWTGGVWNMVFAGVQGAPPTHCGDAGGTPSTNVPATPVISEKPYLSFDNATEKFFLRVPPVKTNSAGYDVNNQGEKVIDFADVYVTRLTDTAADMQAKLDQGLHLVISPGIYHINAPLRVNNSGTIVLGLGLATLVASGQTESIISVGDVDGVRICGLLMQAGPPKDTSNPVQNNLPPAGTTLIAWGTAQGGSDSGSASAPGFLHDVFFRVGGPDGSVGAPVRVETMLHVRRGWVIGDNMWLWRADHANGGVTYSSNQVKHGLVVDGDNVHMYGLAVEHTLEDLTVWNGERGRTFFYQSELPYVVTQAEFPANYSGYKVAAHVQDHVAYGVGVYSFFRDHVVNITSGIVAPASSKFVNPMSVFLNGNGGIDHILNDQGAASVAGVQPQVHYLC
jgi:hypothetical protein